MRMKLFQKFVLTVKEIATQIDLGYEKNKSTSGPNVVESIGLPILKKKCRHFSEWITKLEGLTKET